MNRLSSYSPLQQLSLTRYGRLKMLHRDVVPQLDPSDFRVNVTPQSAVSTYQDLQEQGLEEEARLLYARDEPKSPLPPDPDA